MNANDAPVIGLYAVLALLVIGLGIGILVFQTGADRRAFSNRWGFLFAGVVLILFGGVLLVSQVVAFFV